MLRRVIISLTLIISLVIPNHILADTQAPNPPTGLTAQAEDNYISLSWDANTESDLAGYNMYRSTFSGNYYTKLNASLITPTTYQDNQVVAGSEYFYVITAQDTSGNESEYSNEVRVFANKDIRGQSIKTKTWTSQSDWEEGNAYQIDTTSNPGDVQLERGEFIADEHTVALWHFNEGSGSTLFDSSGNSNDGAINGATWVDGKFGQALSFDGNDYVKKDTVNLPTGSVVTVESWIYPKEYKDSTYNGVVSWGSRSCTGNSFLLSMQNSGRPSMATWCNDFVPTTAPVANLNTWNHIAAVLNGTSVTLYMNGVPVSGSLGSLPNIKSKNLAIGSTDYLGRYFTGFIDEMRISDIARSDLNESRVALSPGTLTLDFDSQQFSNFETLDLTADTPEGTNIKARVKSAYTQSGLEDATWSNYYDTFPADLSGQDNQRWIRIELLLETTNPEASPVIKDLSLTYELAENKQFKTFTSQSDWETGTAFQIDTSSSPGDVQLERGEFIADEYTVALWHFNEGTGSTLADSSGNGNDGTINGATWIDGKFGKALSFDGNDYVKKDTVNLPTGSVATVEAWVCPKGYSDIYYNGIVSWGARSCTGTSFLLSMQNSGRPSMATWCNDFVPTSGPVTNLNAWNHIATVLNGQSVTLYLNGEEVSGTLPYLPNIQSKNLAIGSTDYPGKYFTGLIDEIRISNIARSDFNASRPFLSSGTLTLDFDSRQLSNFTSLDLTADTPEGTGIKARVKSAYTQAGLEDATWSDYYDTFPTNLSNQENKRWIRIELLLETTDTEVTPVVKDLTIEYELSPSPLSLKTWTSQSDWQEGTADQVDTSSSPGDVQLERGEFIADEHTVALWHFNEGTGTTAYDETTNSNDGTLTNMDSANAWVEGKFGKALSFDGVNDYVDVGTGKFPSVIDNFTIEAWVNPTATRTSTSEANSGISGTSGQRYAIYPPQGDTEYGTGHAGAGISVGTNGISVFEHAANYLPSLLVYNTSLSGWNHIAVVYVNKQPGLYLNGTLVRTGLTSTKIVHPGQDIGESGKGYGYFTGFIDEIRISNIARTDLNESRAFFSPGTLTLDFDTGQRSNFVKLDWTTDIPDQTSVNVRFKTADTQEGLDTALWSEYFDTSPVELKNIIDQRWIRIEAYLETQNITQSPVLKNLTIWYTPFESYLDVNRDGVVDEKDSELITKGLGLTEEDSDFNPYLDVNDDGVIDEQDSTDVINSYGATAPQAPTAAYVAAGVGNSHNEINASNYTDVTLNVELPESSSSTDLVRVTLSDGVSEINASSYALDGQGTLLISGIDTGIFLDTNITLTCFVENEAGRSAYLLGEDAYKSVTLAKITSPIEGQVLAEGTSLEIIGTALSPNFDSFVLEYGKGQDPDSWTEIAISTTPVDRAFLATWQVPSEKKTYYTIRLRVMEDNTTVASATVGINILMLYDVSDSPDPFSPNADSIKDTNTITATVTMPVDWSITIKDATDTAVKTFSGSGSSISQTWDGTGQDGLTVVDDGIYTYYIDGQEPASRVSVEEQTGTITLDATYPEAIITSPQEEEVVFLEVEITGTATDDNFTSYKVEYGETWSPTNWNLIKSSTNKVKDGVLATWDTENLSNGRYTLRLSVEDSAGNISTDSVKVNVDNLKLTNISVSPVAFNLSQGETTAISYTLDRDANITIKIYNLNNELVRTLVDSELRTQGENSETWDGKDDAGEIAESFKGYLFTIEATIGEVSDDYQPSGGYVQNAVGVSNFTYTSSFNPYASELCEIRYALASNALINITIGQHGNFDTYYTLVNWEARPQGENVEYWDGRDRNGDILDYYTSSYPIIIAYWTKSLPENTIVVVSEKHKISDFITDPYLIIPVYGEITKINYTLPVAGTVSMAVYSSFDTLIKTLLDNVTQSAGSYTLEWDGKDSSGLVVSEKDEYKVKMQVQTSEGETITREAIINVY